MPKKYSVYGVGSALVDFEFKLADQWPNEIEKGTTLLIDSDAEKKLLNKLSHLKCIKACGGSGANTLSVISQLGGQVFYSCRVSNDVEGIFYHQNLKKLKIESSLDYRVKIPGNTGKSIILINKDADRTLCTYAGASALLSPQDLDETIMANAEYLFVEIFLATAFSSKLAAISAIQMAKQLKCKVALTLTTCKIPGFDKKHLFDIVAQGIDLLFCNELEARFFCETDDIDTIKTKLKKVARQFVITRGAESTLVYDGQNFFEIPTFPVKAIDTTGAGDIFAGAFLQAITTGHSFEKAGELANFAAAQVITQYGPRLDNKSIKVILKKFLR